MPNVKWKQSCHLCLVGLDCWYSIYIFGKCTFEFHIFQVALKTKKKKSTVSHHPACVSIAGGEGRINLKYFDIITRHRVTQRICTCEQENCDASILADQMFSVTFFFLNQSMSCLSCVHTAEALKLISYTHSLDHFTMSARSG